MATVSMKDLLQSGVHFGHQTRRWNPKMKPYIFAERGGIYIIDLQKTTVLIDEAYGFLRNVASRNGTVLFVGTKKQCQETLREEAERVGAPFVSTRWLGGLLTNFATLSKRIKRLHELRQLVADDSLSVLPTRDQMQLRAELGKLETNLGGVAGMERLPDAVFVIDPRKEAIVVKEARKLHIPIVALVDTNCDPDEVDFVIPGNDDAIRSCALIVKTMIRAVEDGKAQVTVQEMTAPKPEKPEPAAKAAEAAEVAAGAAVVEAVEAEVVAEAAEEVAEVAVVEAVVAEEIAEAAVATGAPDDVVDEAIAEAVVAEVVAEEAVAVAEVSEVVADEAVIEAEVAVEVAEEAEEAEEQAAEAAEAPAKPAKAAAKPAKPAKAAPKKIEKAEKSEKAEAPATGDKADTDEKAEKPAKPAKEDKPAEAVKAAEAKKPARAAKPKAEKVEKAAKTEKAEKVEKAAKTEKTDETAAEAPAASEESDAQ